MERWIRLILLAAVLAATLAACSSQKSVATAANGSTCDIDAKKMCEAVREQPVVSSNTGRLEDPRERAENSSATIWQMLHFSTPGGTGIDLQCHISTEHNRVIYAEPKVAGMLTPNDIEFLHDQGLCLN